MTGAWTLAETARVSIRDAAVWRECAGCGALVALPPEVDRCEPCCATAQRETRPARLQRRRVRGWRMPAGAVYVGRPTKWGNPFPADYFGAARAVQLYREWLAGADHLGYKDAAQRRRRVLGSLSELAGRDLACWCPLTDSCHADVLLRIANGEEL